MESAIREQGYTTASAVGSLKTHPALKPLDAARRLAPDLLSQFQLAPNGQRWYKFFEGRWNQLFGNYVPLWRAYRNLVSAQFKTLEVPLTARSGTLKTR
jgi:hypothetical protein